MCGWGLHQETIAGAKNPPLTAYDNLYNQTCHFVQTIIIVKYWKLKSKQTFYSQLNISQHKVIIIINNKTYSIANYNEQIEGAGQDNRS